MHVWSEGAGEVRREVGFRGTGKKASVPLDNP